MAYNGYSYHENYCGDLDTCMQVLSGAKYGDMEQSDGFERLSVLSLAAVISWDRWALRDVYIWCGVLREGDPGLSKPSSIYGDAGEFMLGVRPYLL
jgi:hypothetical protein